MPIAPRNSARPPDGLAALLGAFRHPQPGDGAVAGGRAALEQGGRAEAGRPDVQVQSATNAGVPAANTASALPEAIRPAAQPR